MQGLNIFFGNTLACAHYVTRIDGFVGRIDNYEIELAARDHKIERLERWIQQLAEKSKVELV
jgi:hypothetical protein